MNEGHNNSHHDGDKIEMPLGGGNEGMTTASGVLLSWRPPASFLLAAGPLLCTRARAPIQRADTGVTTTLPAQPFGCPLAWQAPPQLHQLPRLMMAQ